MSEEDKGPPKAGEPMELPTWNRSRTKRRGGEGPQDDAFVTGVKEVGRGAARRGPLIIGAALLVIGVIVTIVVVSTTRQKDAAEATRVLASAARYQSDQAEVGDPELLYGANKGKPVAPVVKDEAERTAAITKQLDELDAAAAGSAPALAGKLVRAAGQLRDGKAAEAEALYRDFIAEAGAGHPLIFSAREGLAFAREAQGDLAGAVAELDALAGEKGVFYRDMALYQKGRILERQGKTEDALAVYRQYIAEYPLQQPSLAQTEVRKRLEELDPKALAGQAPAESPVQVLDGPPGGVP